MKALIGDKQYDTDTAELVGKASSDLPESHLRSWSAALYKRHEDNQFFLAGSGGPMTMFAHDAGDVKIGGSKIVPLDEKDARDWARANLTSEEMEEIESAFEPKRP